MSRVFRFLPWSLLCLSIGMFYFFNRSPFLDDPDAVNFALGLTHFDPLSGQPHPPGYPVYIAIGQVLRPLFSSETTTLTTLSVFSGVAIIPGAFFLFSAYLPPVAVALGLLLFLTLPLTGLEATKAMTDIPGLAAALALLAFALHRIKIDGDKKWQICLLGILVGILGGIRPHALLFSIPVLGAFTSRRQWGFLGGGFLLGCALWLLPTFFLVGMEPYIDVVQRMFLGRFCDAQITPLAAKFDLFIWLKRFAEFFYFTFYSGFGIAFENMQILDWLILSTFGVCGALVIAKGQFVGKSLRPFRVGMGIYFLYLFLFLPTSNARYFLPLLLWIFVEAVSGLYTYSRKSAWVAVAILATLFLIKSEQLLNIRNSVSPPALSSIRYLQDLNSKSPIAVTGFQNSYYRYYWPEAPFLTKSGTYCDGIRNALREKKVVYTSSLVACPDLKIEVVQTFERDARVHLKSNQMRVIKFVNP